MSELTIGVIGERVSTWGEGPVWWEGKLWYVDIEGHAVCSLDPETGEERSWGVGERVGTVVPRVSGGLVIAGDLGMAFLDPESGEKTLIPGTDPEAEKRGDNRFNDGKCDPQGRFWAGTISTVKKDGDANLYRLGTDGVLVKMLEGITNSNGIVWSGDGRTMYYIDTPTKCVDAFDFDGGSGSISKRRTVADTVELGLRGSPDGMAIDAEDRLWVAMCHGGCVVCIDPGTGEVLRTVDVPAVETTACAFGGEGLGELFVTTGVKGDLEEEFGGRVFVVRGLGVTGVRAFGYSEKLTS